MKLGNEPVSPIIYQNDIRHKNEGEVEVENKGMTIRQKACLMAMQGLLAHYGTHLHSISMPSESNLDALVRHSLTAADAVLAEEERTRK